MNAFALGVAGALLLSVGSAQAEWNQVGVGGFVTTYADPATTQQPEGTVVMWSLINFEIEQEASNGRQFLSLKSRFEYDCAKQLNRVLEMTSYAGQMASGEAVANRTDPSGWVPVKPNTVSRSLWELACAKK